MEHREEIITNRTTCRICGRPLEKVLIAFDGLPVAGAYMTSSDPLPDPVYPLTVCRCEECRLTQLRESVQPAFYRRYSFASGVATGYKRYLQSLAQQIAGMLGTGTSVLEVGCSDGTLLSYLRRHGLQVAGFEPAWGPAQSAQQEGLTVMNDFFNPLSAAHCGIPPVSCIIVRHVIEHIDDFEPLFVAIAEMAQQDCTLIIEVPDLYSTMEKSVYSNFYHIHSCYFDVTTLGTLLEKYGWRLGGAVVVDIFGGSMLAWATREKGRTRSDISFRSLSTLSASRVSSEMLENFAEHWKDVMSSTFEFFENLRIGGRYVAGYGAGERTVSLMGMAGLNNSHITVLFDRNPNLIGKCVPGSRIPIMHPDQIAKQSPEYIAIFAQSFENEIIEQQAAYSIGGGRLISLKSGAPQIVRG